jgi:precorrin-6A/cobalt-precorrin-6A reductase
MILLIGGTSETAEFAEALAGAGCRVLVSTATEIPLETGGHPNITRRCGRLDRDGLVDLAREQEIKVIVDASHPYAIAARHNAQAAADRLHIPYLTWVRPTVLDREETLWFARDHEQAARLAFGFLLPVLLTTGSRNLLPYAEESRRTDVDLVVRVLPYRESLEACLQAGIPDAHVVAGRGPFTVEENLATIRRFGIGCMVTKDSGSAGGVHEKLEAARIAGCKVVAVQRPDEGTATCFADTSHLVALVHGFLGHE